MSLTNRKRPTALKYYSCLVLISLGHHRNQVSAFANLPRPSLVRREISNLAATLTFQGDSSATLDLEDTSLESLQDFLQSSSCDKYLLGTEAYVEREDGLWDCQQPFIDFMGMSLQPVFVHRLDRQVPSTVCVSIVDARTDIVNKNNTANRVVASVMKASKFDGKSIISVRSVSTTACQISIALNLTLQIPLPPFFPLPPGFNSIGSALVRKTGKSRTKRVLQDLRDAYELEMQL